MKKKMTITLQMKGKSMTQRKDIRWNLTGEFVIVAKFGGHALRHLASRLANVIRQGGRQTNNLVLPFFKIRIQASILVALFYALYLS